MAACSTLRSTSLPKTKDPAHWKQVTIRGYYSFQEFVQNTTRLALFVHIIYLTIDERPMPSDPKKHAPWSEKQLEGFLKKCQKLQGLRFQFSEKIKECRFLTHLTRLRELIFEHCPCLNLAGFRKRMMNWVYQKGTPVNHLGSPVTVAHSPSLEHLCFLSTPHVQFDLVLWLLHVCCSLRVFIIGLKSAQHDFGEMEMLIRRLSRRKVVLFDCAISSDNSKLTSNEMAEGNAKLWKCLDQPPVLNVKGEKIQFGTCIKEYYCNRNQTPFSHGFLKDQDPVVKFNEEKGEWTPVTPLSWE